MPLTSPLLATLTLVLCAGARACLILRQPRFASGLRARYTWWLAIGRGALNGTLITTVLTSQGHPLASALAEGLVGGMQSGLMQLTPFSQRYAVYLNGASGERSRFLRWMLMESLYFAAVKSAGVAAGGRPANVAALGALFVCTLPFASAQYPWMAAIALGRRRQQDAGGAQARRIGLLADLQTAAVSGVCVSLCACCSAGLSVGRWLLALTGLVGLIWYAHRRGHGNLRELANYWRVFVGNLAPRPAMAWGTVLVKAAAMKPAAIGLAALFTVSLACGKESATSPGTDARPTDGRTDMGAGSDGSGGSGGSGGTGGTGGRSGTGGGSDGPRDMIEAPAETGSDAAGKSVDECFAELPAGEGGWQDATKASSDGGYRMRLALETGQRGGTSGSDPWEPFRFALTTPSASICITDRVMLAAAYMSSHHNCADVLTVTSGGRRYVISNPDSAIDYADQTKYRRPATLAVFEGDTMVAGPILLSTVACNRSSNPDGRCRSGGPCVAQPVAY